MVNKFYDLFQEFTWPCFCIPELSDLNTTFNSEKISRQFESVFRWGMILIVVSSSPSHSQWELYEYLQTTRSGHVAFIHQNFSKVNSIRRLLKSTPPISIRENFSPFFGGHVLVDIFRNYQSLMNKNVRKKCCFWKIQRHVSVLKAFF